MTDGDRANIKIVSERLVVGLEVHVELSTRSKMFTSAPNGACAEFADAPPNSLIDPTVLALPGALPVMNRAAIEMSMMVGMAIGCSIAEFTRWDRKSYFYPDLPKAYQISQYDRPLCFDGALEIPGEDERGEIDLDAPTRRIGIIRAHLEEDAGKLLHEAPGGHAIDGSIIDLNRAGTPLLEIVTHPDFTSSEEAVVFARQLRGICRFLGVTDGIMQKGHIRFEPNINCHLTLEDGSLVKTPIVEIKNLNSFRSLRDAIEHERREQPKRWRRDGKVMGPGAKSTRGWNDAKSVTVLQREKEDAHDYRYFPDPDLLPVIIDDAWRERVGAQIPELPPARIRRYVKTYALATKEAAALVEERDVCVMFDEAVEAAMRLDLPTDRGRLVANVFLQSGARRANERGVLVTDLGISAEQVAGIVRLRSDDAIGSGAADRLFDLLCEPGAAGLDPGALAESEGLLTIRDEGALNAWVDEVVAANEPICAQIRAGKTQAIGRLIGAVMKLSGGSADAKVVRERLLDRIGVTG